MTLNVARQPLVPALLTLLVFTGTAVWHVGNGIEAGSGATDWHTLALFQSPGSWLAAFQSLCPGISAWISGFLLLYAGVMIGRMSVRYNLYSVSTGVTIPLLGLFAGCFLSSSQLLPQIVALALLALSLRNLGRGFCNGYGFDGLFRGGIYLGMLPLIEPALLPLILLLPIALLLFGRTVRESVVASVGLLLPITVWSYVGWGMGHSFTDLALQIYDAVIVGTPLALFRTLSLVKLCALGGIALVDLFAFGVFLSDMYAVGNKPRLIIICNSCLLLLFAALLCTPAFDPDYLLLLAIPSAVVLPFMLVRVHHYIALILYLLLIAGSCFCVFMQ